MDSTTEDTGGKLHEHQVNAGRSGGRSRSDAKRDAVRANLAKARAKRWPGREVAAMATMEASNEQEKREVLPDSQSAIAIGGPCRQSPSSDQHDGGVNQPEDGEPKL